jgi:hypothetical protein
MTEVCPAIITPTDWFGITEYDPSRQDWSVQIFNMAPGQRYHIQIDGHGWCMGCAQFMWQDEIINLGITPNQESILYQLLPVNHPYKMRFDSAGRLIR